MLGLVSQRAALLYVCFDMGLYLLFKIVRGDFFYWLPLNGLLEIVVSAVVRVIAKVIVDYTSNGKSSKKFIIVYWRQMNNVWPFPCRLLHACLSILQQKNYFNY